MAVPPRLPPHLRPAGHAFEPPSCAPYAVEYELVAMWGGTTDAQRRRRAQHVA